MLKPRWIFLSVPFLLVSVTAVAERKELNVPNNTEQNPKPEFRINRLDAVVPTGVSSFDRRKKVLEVITEPEEGQEETTIISLDEALKELIDVEGIAKIALLNSSRAQYRKDVVRVHLNVGRVLAQDTEIEFELSVTIFFKSKHGIEFASTSRRSPELWGINATHIYRKQKGLWQFIKL